MRVAKVLAVCCKNLFKLLVVHSLVLSSSIIFVCWPTPTANSHQLSSSFDRSIWELTKLSCELSLLNSHQLSSSFDRSIWELTNLSCELSLLNSHQLSTSFDLALRSLLLKKNYLFFTRTLRENFKESYLVNYSLSLFEIMKCSSYPADRIWRFICFLSYFTTNRIEFQILLEREEYCSSIFHLKNFLFYCFHKFLSQPSGQNDVISTLNQRWKLPLRRWTDVEKRLKTQIGMT